MVDSLEPASLLADRLEGRIELVLPEAEPVIDDRALPATRMELRQVAGLGAGGSLELTPGRWEIGPSERSTRLSGGEPDRVGFTLQVDDDLSVVVEPGSNSVRIDDEPLLAPTPAVGRTIDAGSARFEVARPRPTRRRSGEIPPGQVDPWVLDPIPRSGAVGSNLVSLVAQRRRSHFGPDDLRHRIETGRSHLWSRGPDHPLFGTAVAGMVDVELASTAGRPASAHVLPVAVDLLRSATIVAGRRTHQLAVVRHLLVALAATVHPRDLRIGLRSPRADLAFVRRLPHAAARLDGFGVGRNRRRPRTLLIIDRDQPNGGIVPGDVRPGGDQAVLVLGVERGPVPDDVGVIAVTGERSLSIRCPRSGDVVRGATPIGYGLDLAAELTDLLAMIETGTGT